jgi:putative ATPase
LHKQLHTTTIRYETISRKECALKPLSDYLGQQHLVGEGAVLRQAITSGKIPSFILWGPPGVGKTTLAKIIANDLDRPFHMLSAINSGVKDVRETIQKAKSQRFFLFPQSYTFH